MIFIYQLVKLENQKFAFAKLSLRNFVLQYIPLSLSMEYPGAANVAQWIYK